MKKDITTKEIIEAITKDLAKYILELKIENIKFIDKELKRIEKREAKGGKRDVKRDKV